jgi:hypothetical protein
MNSNNIIGSYINKKQNKYNDNINYKINEYGPIPRYIGCKINKYSSLPINYNLKGGSKTIKNKRYVVKLNIKHINKNNIKYIEVSQNQLQILDALLYDGGYKKYIDSNKRLRYSEHSGLFDFTSSKLERIVVSGKTNREDADDAEILLPQNMPDAFDYEYMFHTHPPTPYPGARALSGILYEFPSVSDLYHFAYHYNNGDIQGSLIIAPEGIYIIRAKNNIKYIDYPSNKIAIKMEDIHSEINMKAIEKHGSDYFNEKQEKFYKNVAQDKTYIKMYNKMVKTYFNENMVVSYKPRKYDKKTNKWIIKNLYIKIETNQN